MLADAHCHFFSANFLRTLGREASAAGLLPPGEDAAVVLPARLGWEAPGDDVALADRWVAALDNGHVDRAMVIASVPGDEDSVAAAVARHSTRLVGAFMVNPAAPDAAARVDRAFGELGLRTACVFPAMHHVAVDDAHTDAVFASASRHRRAVFVHCGVLSVGIRKKLGLPSRFDLRLGSPLAAAAMAVRYPDVPVVIPHFGAGLLREVLMAADAAPNILLDTSSSNSWVKFDRDLTLRDVFAQALRVVGASRLLFGTDSSFFPRGWQRTIHEEQQQLLTELDVSAADQALIFGGNFERVFGR